MKSKEEFTNKKVWRDDMKIMVIVNATANNILSLADGKKPFSNLVEESFRGGINIGQLNLESMETVNLAAELEDRFLQSAVFCVSMWERGLLKLRVAKGEPDKMIVSPLLQSISDNDGNIEIATAIEKLAEQKGEPAGTYAAFNQLRANLVVLLAYDKLLVTFTGTIEDYNDQEIVPDTNWPQCRIGYLQPGLIVTKPSTGEEGEIRFEPITALTAITVTTTLTTYAPMIGDSVGRAESR